MPNIGSNPHRVMLKEGSIVDFVLGNGSADNLYADESFLRAIIMVSDYQVVPEPSMITLLIVTLLTAGAVVLKKRRRVI